MKKPRKKTNAPKPPRVCTNAYEAFFRSYSQINSFFHFVLSMVGHIDTSAQKAHNALISIVSNDEKVEMEEKWKKRVTATDGLRRQRQFFIEVILVRHIENYLNFLSSLLNEIFIHRPETLKSSEKIDIASVLEHDSISGLVRAIAERKVESLSYSSFSDLNSFFWDKFHLKLFKDNDLPLLANAIETRNISVHNRCIINRRYVYRTGDNVSKIGKLRELSIEFLDELVPILSESAILLDSDARHVLHLKGHRFSMKDLGRA